MNDMRKACLQGLPIVSLIVFVLLLYFHEMFDIYFWKKKTTCGSSKTGRPFYFGTTNLECMRLRQSRIKRSFVKYDMPKRKYLALTHRWIFYEGWYFELFYKPRTKKPAKVPPCRYEREAFPAGYSTLDVGCMRRCAMYYNDRFEPSYNPWTYNCHHYANKLAEVLCTFSRCPEWCDLPQDNDAINVTEKQDVVKTVSEKIETETNTTDKVVS